MHKQEEWVRNSARYTGCESRSGRRKVEEEEKKEEKEEEQEDTIRKHIRSPGSQPAPIMATRRNTPLSQDQVTVYTTEQGLYLYNKITRHMEKLAEQHRSRFPTDRFRSIEDASSGK